MAGLPLKRCKSSIPQTNLMIVVHLMVCLIRHELMIIHLQYNLSPVRTPGAGGKVENTSSESRACHKRRLNGAVCRNHRIKKGGPVSL